MRNILPAALLLSLFWISASAGEVNTPGIVPPPPPPCEVNCTSATTASYPLATSVLLMVLPLISK